MNNLNKKDVLKKMVENCSECNTHEGSESSSKEKKEELLSSKYKNLTKK